MISVAHDDDGWGEPALTALSGLDLHPGTHALHYASTCFEGLKAHRGVDGVGIFRLGDHVERMRRSAPALHLPVPGASMLAGMIREVVAANLGEVPQPPGSLYIRPVLMGIEANIGAVGVPPSKALLYVVVSPVGDYFSGGLRPLKISIETDTPRTTPQFGTVKAGANYALALGIVLKAKDEHGVDQVLFAPNGEVQETGASNFLLIADDKIVTPALTDGFLHGITRDSVLKLAADLGYWIEERRLAVDEVVDWARQPGNEAALTGTAAVLAPVGTLVHKGEDVPVGDGGVGENTKRIRKALTDLQVGQRPDTHHWLTPIGTP